MPDLDPPHSASPARAPHPSRAATPGASGDDGLASLFRHWDAEPEDRRARAERTGIWLRAGVTIALFVAAALVMSATARSVAYFFEPSSARDLGDLRAGAPGQSPALGPDNAHVAVRGLVPTRLIAVQDVGDAEGAEALLFYCPLGGVVVYTSQAIPPASAADADPRLAALVAAGHALAEETALAVAAEGRLVRAEEAPSELAPFVQSFSQRTRRPLDTLWVLLDGVRPAGETWAIPVWALAALAPLVSLFFLARAVQKRWARRRETTRAPITGAPT